MDERVVKFRVGVVVLSTLFLAGILVMLFGDTRSVFRGGYTIYMHFTDAPGVTEGTPVRKSGILIGRVTKVSFAEQGGVNVTAEINPDVKLFHSEIPQVSGSILGGDVVIQFVRRTKPAAPAAPPDVRTGAEEGEPGKKSGSVPQAANPDAQVQGGEWIEGTVAPNALQVINNLEGELGRAISSLSSAGDEVSKLANNVNRILADNDEQINRIVSKTEQTLDSFQRSLASFEDVFGDANIRDKIKQSISNLPELLEDTRAAVNTIRTTVDSVDRNLRNLEGLTGPLGERGEHIVERVDHSVTRLDLLLGELSDFGKKLNSGEGSLGQLMRNPELFQHLNNAAKNIDQVTRELKPIICDARVFSDKIARHPEILGVRGAIQRNPGIK